MPVCRRRRSRTQLTDGKRVRLLTEDGLTLPSVADGSVDVIVTDPPWGEHEEIERPFDHFARAVGTSFARVLHPRRGRYVLLINRRNAAIMRDGLAGAGLPPDDEHEVLVNGHPATVLIGRRTRPRPTAPRTRAGPQARRERSRRSASTRTRPVRRARHGGPARDGVR